MVSADVTSAPVRRSRSLLQGDPSSPDLFNATLDLPATEFCKLAVRKGWGYRLDDGSHVSLLLFADNFWLVATSPQELASMTEAWLALLREYGWSVPLNETTWCSTGPDSNHHWIVNVAGQKLPRAPRSTGFKVLGTQVCFDNCFEVELQNRISRAWRAFYKFADLLCCQAAPWKNRLQLLSLLVGHSLFWCSGSWNLTARQVSKVRGLQQDILHKMVRLKRLE